MKQPPKGVASMRRPWTMFCIFCLLLPGTQAFGEQRWILKNSFLKYKQNPSYCVSLREGKVANGVDVILWHCNPDAEHKFKVNGNYIQYEADPSYCLGVREGKIGDGSDIILWKCAETPEFHWEMDGEFIKYKANPRFAMVVRNDNPMDGADIILWTVGGMNDKWSFDGKLIRMETDRNKCLSVRLPAGEGSKVYADKCGNGGTAVRWSRIGSLIRWETNPKYCLSIRQGHIMDGEDVILWSCAETAEFQWEVSGSFIKHKENQDDYCLSVRETSGYKAAADAVIWSCQAVEPLGLPVSADQRQQTMADENVWRIDGPYIKSSLDTKYCASVRQGEITDGSDIIMWHCSDGREFKWLIQDGLIKLQANPSYCMSVREGRAGDGSDIILWSCARSNAYRWKVDGGSIVFEADQRYFLSVRQGRIQDGADVILWSGFINPFLFTFDGFLLKPKADPSRCVSVREGKIADGSDAILWQCSTTDEYRWTVSQDHLVLGSDEHYCLAVREGKCQDGADVILWTCGDDHSSRWVVDGERIRWKAESNGCGNAWRAGDSSDSDDATPAGARAQNERALSWFRNIVLRFFCWEFRKLYMAQVLGRPQRSISSAAAAWGRTQSELPSNHALQQALASMDGEHAKQLQDDHNWLSDLLQRPLARNDRIWTRTTGGQFAPNKTQLRNCLQRYLAASLQERFEQPLATTMSEVMANMSNQLLYQNSLRALLPCLPPAAVLQLQQWHHEYELQGRLHAGEAAAGPPNEPGLPE
eukprot:s4645_g3.t1